MKFVIRFVSKLWIEQECMYYYYIFWKFSNVLKIMEFGIDI